ncbi:hypothetical protein L7F22_028996 [Adiantum nelumboides]|nr:hypothetical protein [Adiantum nelumboides]
MRRQQRLHLQKRGKQLLDEDVGDAELKANQPHRKKPAHAVVAKGKDMKGLNEEVGDTKLKGKLKEEQPADTELIAHQPGVCKEDDKELEGSSMQQMSSMLLPYVEVFLPTDGS